MVKSKECRNSVEKKENEKKRTFQEQTISMEIISSLLSKAKPGEREEPIIPKEEGGEYSQENLVSFSKRGSS